MKLKVVRFLTPLLLIGGAANLAAANSSGNSAGNEVDSVSPPPDLSASLNDDGVFNGSGFNVAPGARLEGGNYTTPFSRDYVVGFERDTRSNQYTVFNTTAAHSKGVATSSFAASSDPRLQPLTRLESTWSTALPDWRAQMRVGDAISNPGTWGHAVRFGGVQIANTSGLRSDVVTAPLYGSGAVLPSTADLLGADLRNAALNGGRFSGLVPHATQNGAVTLPVSDALGRNYVVSRSLFQSISLMPRGQSDFSVEAGRVREDFARRSDSYGAWLVSGTYRYGLGSKATLDAHAASIANEVSVVGIGVSERVDGLGLLSATMATSRTPDDSGWLARMGYETNVKGINLAVRSHVQSLSFQDLRATQGVEPVRERTLASAGMSLYEFGNVSVAGVTQSYGDGQREGLLALSHSIPLGVSGMFSTAATFAPGPVRSSAVMLSVSYPFTVAKRRVQHAPSRNAINNLNNQNLLAVLDTTGTTRPVK